MSKVLFVNHASIGHLNTLLTIALQMKSEGHEVSFLVPGAKNINPKAQILKTGVRIPNLIRASGIEAEVIAPPKALIPAMMAIPKTTGYPEFMLVWNIFSGGIAQYTQQILEHLMRLKPDVIVTDFAFYATNVAADAAGIPWITIFHSGLPFRGAAIPPFASGLPIGTEYRKYNTIHNKIEKFMVNLIDRRINNARRQVGLPALPADIMRRPYSPWLNLVASAEAIEAPRDNLTANTLYIGPCFQGRRPSSNATFPFEKLRADRYKIYISLGTVFNNKPAVFQKLIAALDKEAFQLIISAGGAYKTLAAQKLPENVLLFESVPQLELLPKVDLVIGHGGNNSTNETLAAGKPLLVLSVGGEQNDNARRVEYLKVGYKLDIYRLTEDDIYWKVVQLLNTPAFAARAQELKTAIAETDGPRIASACIDWVARAKQPLQRPANLPLTVTPAELPELFATGHALAS